MDPRSFDRLSRSFATGASRRQALRALTVGGAVGLVSRLKGGEAAAQVVEAEDCRGRRRQCDRNRQCCGNNRGVVCDPLPRACNKDGQRCCGRTDAPCQAECDCCKGFTCNRKGRCKQK